MLKFKILTIFIFSFLTLNATGDFETGNPVPTSQPQPTSTPVARPIADNKDNPEMQNSLGPVNILDLSGTDARGEAVHQFMITSLPSTDEGVLFHSDGETRVAVFQLLTQEEADGLRFDPNENFEGEVRFGYIVIDSNGVRSTPASVTIPVVTTVDTIETFEFRVDDKKNPQMLNSLGPVDILDLSGQDIEGNALEVFRIISLPLVNQGILYMADGTTPVRVNQELTREEANGIKFDPNANFVGTVSFDYVGLNDNGEQSSSGTVTIPVIAPVVAGVGKDDCCPDYTEGVPSLNHFSLLVLLLMSMLLGDFFLREEKRMQF